MKRFSVLFYVFCAFGLSSVTLTALLKKSNTAVKSRSKILSKPLSKIAAARSASMAPSGQMVSGAMVSGANLSNLNLNPIGALSNIASKTTGNTAISLDGSAFASGATIAVGSNNAVQGAQQSISNVLGGSNTAMVSGYSGNAASVANSAASGLKGGNSSGVSNILNQTTGDFTFNMNGVADGGGSGGVGSLTLQNGSTVMGGLTTTGIVGGTTNQSSVSKEPVTLIQPS